MNEKYICYIDKKHLISIICWVLTNYDLAAFSNKITFDYINVGRYKVTVFDKVLFTLLILHFGIAIEREKLD